MTTELVDAGLSTQPDDTRPPRRGTSPLAAVLVTARNAWRRLTSMRTALVLLFLLALAAIPGSLLPQRRLNPLKVNRYIADHPGLGRFFDRIGFFDVFASPWFAAIYLLLFISLIGCLVPRIRKYAGQLVSKPPAAPRNLDRLPHSDSYETDLPPTEAADQARSTLRGWRVVRREEPDGAITLSAERGYLREAGNLVFHLGLTTILVGVAVGKLWGYEGQILVEEGRGFCNTVSQYDQFSPGSAVKGSALAPFCVDLDQFTATYERDGTPANFRADIRYSNNGGPEQRYPLEVNHPLRIDGVRLYLISHGFSPRFTVTTPAGQHFDGITTPFLPQDVNLTSEGTLKLPDAQPKQLAIEGLFAPTAIDLGDGVITSVSPQPDVPALAVFVYQGSLGLDSGRPQNVYVLDQQQVTSGALKRVAAKNMLPGETVRLDDGTTIRFDGFIEWASMQVSRDPAQQAVLIAFAFLLAGLLVSLTVRRRRVWVRVAPAGEDPQRTVVRVGGLSRTESGGFAAEFARLVGRLRGVRED